MRSEPKHIKSSLPRGLYPLLKIRWGGRCFVNLAPPRLVRSGRGTRSARRRCERPPPRGPINKLPWSGRSEVQRLVGPAHEFWQSVENRVMIPIMRRRKTEGGLVGLQYETCYGHHARNRRQLPFATSPYNRNKNLLILGFMFLPLCIQLKLLIRCRVPVISAKNHKHQLR